jgi:hypothetical protein
VLQVMPVMDPEVHQKVKAHASTVLRNLSSGLIRGSPLQMPTPSELAGYTVTACGRTANVAATAAPPEPSTKLLTRAEPTCDDEDRGEDGQRGGPRK